MQDVFWSLGDSRFQPQISLSLSLSLYLSSLVPEYIRKATSLIQVVADGNLTHQSESPVTASRYPKEIEIDTENISCGVTHEQAEERGILLREIVSHARETSKSLLVH